MKIEEYIKNMKIYNLENYLSLNNRKLKYDFIELLNTNFINTQEYYNEEMNKFNNLSNNNIINFFNLIKHIFVYKLIISNMIYDNNYIYSLFYTRLEFELYNKDKMKEIIYSINNKTNESFTFDKNITTKKNKFLMKNNDVPIFLKKLENKYKISKKSCINIYIYYNNNDIKKIKMQFVNHDNINYNELKIKNIKNIKYIIKFNRIIFKKYDIHMKFDFDLVVYYSINDLNNILLFNSDNYCILNYTICKIKYIDSCEDLMNNSLKIIKLPNYISKLLICNFFIENIDYNNWFRNNIDIKNMNEDIENISIIEKNIDYDSFILENNNIEKNIIKKLNRNFYLAYMLLFIIISIDIINFIR